MCLWHTFLMLSMITITKWQLNIFAFMTGYNEMLIATAPWCDIILSAWHSLMHWLLSMMILKNIYTYLWQPSNHTRERQFDTYNILIILTYENPCGHGNTITHLFSFLQCCTNFAVFPVCNSVLTGSYTPLHALFQTVTIPC